MLKVKVTVEVVVVVIVVVRQPVIGDISKSVIRNKQINLGLIISVYNYQTPDANNRHRLAVEAESSGAQAPDNVTYNQSHKKDNSDQYHQG